MAEVSGGRRVLVVVFDALRPDMVSPSLMPNLSAHAAAGVRFSASRAVFPTETRVNQSALVTGCSPGRHGIVGNKLVEPTASPGRLFDTADEDLLREGDRRLPNGLFAVPSLGELLGVAGRQLATLSAGTPGGGRILNHRAEQHGGFRFAMHRPDAAVPGAAAAALLERVGPIPPHAVPSIEWLTWATDAWLNYVEPELRPDVGILWYCEPDSSYHYCGIGSPQNEAAMRHADLQFGRILAALGEQPELQLVTLSDHGQIAASGPPLDVAARLRAAGFSVGEVPGPTAQMALALDSAGGVFIRDHDAALTRQVADWLRRQSWVGALSLGRVDATIEGTLKHSLIGIDGPRAPDIGLVLAASNHPGPWHWRGSSLHDATYPPGGGTHGGLHPVELNNWLAMSGSGFARQRDISTAAGIIDILPTILNLLGIAIPGHVEGRVLVEAMTPRPIEVRQQREHIAVIDSTLSISRIGKTRYLDGIVPVDSPPGRPRT